MTIKIHHFEDLWQKAETVAKQYNDISLEMKLKTITELLQEMNQTQGPEQALVFGKILFQLCSVSDELNINAFAALMSGMQAGQMSGIVDE